LDASRLDALARSIANTAASRRSVVAGIGALLLAAIPTSDVGAKKKKKRCKRKKRCGKDCCNGSSCFEKRFNEDDSTEVLEYDCCPTNSICKSELPNWEDQCCYGDEVCDPLLPERDLFADSICCRQCGDLCLSQSEECVDGVPTPLSTARLPRHRR
jgi:hypothetical protein